jgi:hypothetical protein
MLLKVLAGTNAERRYTGGLSRSGASPYQHLEDEYEDENPDDRIAPSRSGVLPLILFISICYLLFGISERT